MGAKENKRPRSCTYKMKLDKQVGYVEAYLTLGCNLNCSYCINDPDDQTVRKRDELTGREWKRLNQIDFGNVPLTLGGGEPTIHPDFYEILDGLRDDIQVDLLTNGQFNVREFISRTSPDRFTKKQDRAYKSIRMSYHPEQMNPESLVKKATKLQEEGFRVGIFGINHPLNIGDNIRMAEMTRQNRIYFHIKDFLGEFKGKMYGHFRYPDAVEGENRLVLCRSSEVLIGPEGKQYKCHRDLYRQENPIGELSDLAKPRFRECGNYGDCNPCDVKVKMSRELKGGHCPVEIE